jgi:hypothetical protein
MNWENGWVSPGGDERELSLGDELGVWCLIWLGLPSGGVMVPSLKVSVAVDPWFVRGDGR